MWKFFSPNKDNIRDILVLREMFPNHEFANGMHKGKRGVFAFPKGYDNNREYAERHPSNEWDDVMYWEPTEKSLENFDLEKWEMPSEWKIPLVLGCGQKLRVIPATAIPKRVIFGKKGIVEKNRKEEIEFAANYNTEFDYGKMAYGMLYRFRDEEIEFSDPDLKNLITECLRCSFRLPMDVINSVLKISTYDINLLFYAAMGSDLEFLEKKEKASSTT